MLEVCRVAAGWWSVSLPVCLHLESVNTHTRAAVKPRARCSGRARRAEAGGDSLVLEQRSQVRGLLSVWQDHFSEGEEGRGAGQDPSACSPAWAAGGAGGR